MDYSERIEKIKCVLNLIEDERLQNGLKEVVKMLPDYFFYVSTSPTQKFHPEFSNGEGGLLRHCIAAATIGHEMMRDSVICSEEVLQHEDLIILSLFLHDGCKRGWPKEHDHSVFDHPLIMAKFLKKNATQFPSLTKDEIDFMAEAIETHMGPFTKDWRTGKTMLNEPKTDVQKFVHLCDYVSSRKCIDFQF